MTSSSNSVAVTPPAKIPPTKGLEHLPGVFFSQCESLSSVKNPRMPSEEDIRSEILEPKGGLWESFPQIRGQDSKQIGLARMFNEEKRKRENARKEAQNPVSERAPREDSHDRDSQETVRPESVVAVLDFDNPQDPRWLLIGLAKK
ncbi:hypothetical protein EYC84_007111 [Monilinia fructicola]|uniref:Uncharacterized protein n=1 Tax=Monilinia fructicola TaxID=38448 RepID=A0A5M9K888_MONFR|nr:hypothetical protein EYC84_007111 [Monilinia fructicola]